MPKPVPTRLNQLTPPNDGYNYFEAAAKRPFEQGKDFSAVNAWWCAEASMLAYSNAVHTSTVMPQGWRYEPILSYPLGSTQAFAMCNRDARIIAFRGTQLSPIEAVVKDVLTDVDVIPVAANSAQSGALAHRGFTRQFDLMANLVDAQVKAAADKQQKVWFTGHSLGGALALLAGVRNPSATVEGIYTFGMPRVGNQQLGKSPGVYGKLHRVVHASDGIPSLPPGYAHTTEAHRIDANGKWVSPLTSSLGLSSILSAALSQGTSLADMLVQQLSGMGPEGALALLPPGKARFLTDHAPIYYATRLYNMVE